jgi:hypothetical protein
MTLRRTLPTLALLGATAAAVLGPLQASTAKAASGDLVVDAVTSCLAPAWDPDPEAYCGVETIDDASRWSAPATEDAPGTAIPGFATMPVRMVVRNTTGATLRLESGSCYVPGGEEELAAGASRALYCDTNHPGVFTKDVFVQSQDLSVSYLDADGEPQETEPSTVWIEFRNMQFMSVDDSGHSLVTTGCAPGSDGLVAATYEAHVVFQADALARRRTAFTVFPPSVQIQDLGGMQGIRQADAPEWGDYHGYLAAFDELSSHFSPNDDDQATDTEADPSEGIYVGSPDDDPDLYPPFPWLGSRKEGPAPYTDTVTLRMPVRIDPAVPTFHPVLNGWRTGSGALDLGTVETPIANPCFVAETTTTTVEETTTTTEAPTTTVAETTTTTEAPTESTTTTVADTTTTTEAPTETTTTVADTTTTTETPTTTVAETTTTVADTTSTTAAATTTTEAPTTTTEAPAVTTTTVADTTTSTSDEGTATTAPSTIETTTTAGPTSSTVDGGVEGANVTSTTGGSSGGVESNQANRSNSQGTLVRTGADVARLAVVGLVLVAGGAVLVRRFRTA